jgi:hypothetical protein
MTIEKTDMNFTSFFFKKKQCLVPTTASWITILCFILFASCITLFSIHPFLAQNKRIQADALIVEGWLPDYALAMAAKEFSSHSYKCLFVTGGPLERGSFLLDYTSFAVAGSKSLIRLGVDSTKIVTLPSPWVKKDRTFAEAVAVLQWLNTTAPQYKTFNIYSFDCHARRTYMLYSKVLSKKYSCGILSCPDGEFDSTFWWTSSAGFRTTTGEIIAYLYARFLFWN